MPVVILSLLAAAVVLRLIFHLTLQQWISPDGTFYRQVAAGMAVPVPYNLRWALPKVMFTSAWPWIHRGCAIVTPALVAVYGRMLGLSETHALVAGLIVLGLPGLMRFNSIFALYVDTPAFVIAMCAALASLSGHWLLAIGLALVAGACKESAPIFAAAWSLNPWLLLGVAACGWWIKPVKETGLPLWCDIGSGKHQWWDIRKMIMPWGACAVMFPAGVRWDAVTLSAAIALCLGYGQLLVAHDEARLYSWAAPAVAVVSARAFGEPISIAAMVLHFLNPAMGV